MVFCAAKIQTVQSLSTVDYSNCQALLQLRAKHGGPAVLAFCTGPTAQQEGTLALEANGCIKMSLCCCTHYGFAV